MSEAYGKGMDVEGELVLDKREFSVDSLESEIRVDGLCQKVLKRFYVNLLEEGMTPERATELANSADYFVRDYVVGIRQRNLFEERPGIVRQFAGNWYIVNTIEPHIAQLAGHLEGIAFFYGFLLHKGLISEGFHRQVKKECAELSFYEARIESFWNITGDGYTAWERDCSLKEP